MIFHGGVEHIEIGIFENGKAEIWRIESLTDDDYYYESVIVDNEKHYLKVSDRDGFRYNCKMKLVDFPIEGKRLLASKKNQYIRKFRKRLLKLIDVDNRNIKISNNVLKERRQNVKIIIRFNRKGEVIFVEKNKYEGKQKYIQKLFN